MIHDQKTLYGSWVTNVWRMDELLERLARWEVHPADLVSHRFSLDDAPKAYELMASGNCGKVAEGMLEGAGLEEETKSDSFPSLDI